MNIEKIKRLWDKAQEYSNSLPPEEISVQRTVGFYDCLCRLDSSHPEQGEQGELYRLKEIIETERKACESVIKLTEQNKEMVKGMGHQIAAFDICLKHIKSFL